MTEITKCTCSVLDGWPEVSCPMHGQCARLGHVGHCDGCPDPTIEGELGRLRNRITALEANGSELLARGKQLAAENERLEKHVIAELERLHSWAGLLSLLDEHWPEDIFPTEPDSETRDSGPRIVSLLRWVERLRGELHVPESNADAPSPVTAATDTNLRERLHEAISDSWSTMPTCWEAQIRAVLAVLHVEDDMDLRDLIGPMLDAAQVRDADGVTALVADAIWPVVEQLRAERDAAKATTEALAAGRGRSVLDRVSDWAENALDASVTTATEAHGETTEAQEARELLLDPDCRDGKHGSCVGGPCECPHHTHTPIGDPGEPDEGPYCEACGNHWPCREMTEAQEGSR